MKYCFVFVCQQGELEIKSLLLAASLHRYLRCEHELVAALPGPETVWGRPADATLALLEQWGVRRVSIENPIGPDYPIGNKLACMNAETSAGKIVFLDSDMLCLREFHHEPRFEIAFNAKPADFATYGSAPEKWRRVYDALHLPMPAARMLATVSGEAMPPYFNAGMIAVRRELGLGDAWIEVARSLDADPRVADKRPWLDQISLPPALARLEMDYDCLDERFNYPAHAKPLDPEALPFFCHYHTPEVLRAEPMANAVVCELAHRYPALETFLAGRPAWADLLRPYRLDRNRRRGWVARAFGLAQRQAGRWGGAGHASASGNDGRAATFQTRPKEDPASPPARGRFHRAAGAPQVIITGIPRSGTSYLCSILNTVPDWVVINEPADIFEPLANQTQPWGVPLYYRDLRRRILDGLPVQNKLHDGEFIEDTAVVDRVESYLPRVTRPDFVLATKNTLAYLAGVARLRRVMPHATFVACVRHPLDAIASWKRSFPHLREVAIPDFPAGFRDERFLSGAARSRLAEIAATGDAALRRALLWRHLAECILENADRLMLLRYEDLVANPERALKPIFRLVCRETGSPMPARPEPSTPRLGRETLSAREIQTIRAICAQAAAQLGYTDI